MLRFFCLSGWSDVSGRRGESGFGIEVGGIEVGRIEVGGLLVPLVIEFGNSELLDE